MTKKSFYSLSGLVFATFLTLSVFSLFTIEAKAAGTGAVSINSVTIAGGNVSINVSASDIPDSDDGVYYLFAEKAYQGAPAGEPVASLPAAANAAFTIPLGYQTADCHLYDKFQVAVKQGGAYVPVAGAKYITNPEALAGNSPARKNNGKRV